MAAMHLDEQQIFEVARKIEAHAAREAYLQQVCGDDATLDRRVRALLQAYKAGASFLEPPVHVLATTPQPMVERPGTQIGPYKLLQQIGEGGMGMVFMAEQSHPIQRTVALKIIKPGMDTWPGDCPLRSRTAGPGADGSSEHRQGSRRRHDRRGSALLRHGTGQGRSDHRVLRRAAPFGDASGWS